MPRPRKNGACRRVQLRIKSQNLGLFDSYSVEELSELMNRAIESMSPGFDLGDRLISVVRPVVPVSKTICRLLVEKTAIYLLFPEKHDEFRDVVKALGYEWSNPYWSKTIASEVKCDRAAEVSHRLLLAGFCVQVESEIIKAKAIAAKYEPEHYRKVSVSNAAPWKGWFRLAWPQTEDLYDEVKKITASKWTDGGMVVPPEHYREVEDFADLNGFWLSPEAEEALAIADQAWEQSLIICPAEHRKRKGSNRKPLPDPSLATIPDELMDNEP